MDAQDHYLAALSDACSGYMALRPPKRVKISEGAAETLKMQTTGQAGGMWDSSSTPYMVKPMDTCASRKHDSVIFVGPARTGKTAGLLLGNMAHAVVNDPGDMLFIQMDKTKARDFAKTDIARAVLHSDKIREMLTTRQSDKNTFDIMFKNGMWLKVGWPVVSHVSGSTYRYVFITDYDRITNAENVGGEGNLFALARKRVESFLSRGIAVAESSPGKAFLDPNWAAATMHEAPPCGGILGLYNQSDRNRWYWQCFDCLERFEASPGLGLFNLPAFDEIFSEVRMMNVPAFAQKFGSRIICPHCGCLIEKRFQRALNSNGIWIPDSVNGETIKSKTAGFWLGGVAANFQDWVSLVERYVSGIKDYALSGSEETLKTTTNTDQGMPYMARYLIEAKNQGKTPQERAEADLKRFIVPMETRTLLASIDVQGGKNAGFVVQVHAVGPFREQWLIDRFTITESRRPGMGQEFAPIDPAKYAEDWDQITEMVLRKTYRTYMADKEMKLKCAIIDTGGEEGATAMAYAYMRRLKRLGIAHMIRLYKGASEPKAPIVKESWVGGRSAKEQGDVQLYLCNPNLLADAVDAGLKRQSTGYGYIHFPKWLPDAFYDELGAEIRRENGVWEKIRKRNESFDLCKMIHALILILGIDRVEDWSMDAVPAWLRPLSANDHIITAETRRELQANTPIVVKPAAVAPQPRRRTSRMAGF